MSDPMVEVDFNPTRSRVLGHRWMARVGVIGDYGFGRTRRKAIDNALRIYNRQLFDARGSFKQQISLEDARREVAR